MITKTFFDKCNTIIKNSNANLGLYPISMLNYGLITSRFLIHFNLDNIIKKYKHDYINQSNLTHTIKMQNCGSIDNKSFHELIESNDKNGLKCRASSFEIIACKIKEKWDQGNGFDETTDFYNYGNNSAFSTQGSTWYNTKTNIPWEENGVYSIKTIEGELKKFYNNEKSIIITTQSFDYGNENINLNISNYINDIINGKEINNGILIMFNPLLEDAKDTITKYVGFFNNHTNTIYQPYLETKYNSKIQDDRNNFLLGKENKLYFYSIINDSMTDLDNNPICTIDDKQYDVVHQDKGLYYSTVKLTKADYDANMILYDVWSNLSYNGDEIDDIENEFVTLDSNLLFNSKNKAVQANKITVALNGINDYEKVSQNQIKEVSVDFLKPYCREKINNIKQAQYKIYIKEESKEIDIIDWDDINICADYNYFLIDTNNLLPHEYFVDVKIEYKREILLFKEKLVFSIVNNFTNKDI